MVIVGKNCDRITRSTIKARGRAVFVQYTGQPSGSPVSGLMVVEALGQAGYEVHTVFAQNGTMAAEYAKRSVSVQHIAHGQWLAGGPWHRRLRRLARDFAQVRPFRRLFRQLLPDVVYVNNLTGLSAVWAARRMRIPCIWHLRELLDDVEGEMHAPWPGGKRLVHLFVKRLPQRIVAISQAVAENVVGQSQHPKLTVIPNAVSDAFFTCGLRREEARRQLGLPDKIPIIGVPGTLRPVKGHRFFLEALHRVVHQTPECLAALTGEGPPRYRTELDALIRDLCLSKNACFVGTVVDMPAFYRACDVVCVPSRSEPFGRTVVEAFACGTPVVATNVGGIRETVEHEHTGLLVPYRDIPSLAAALLELLNDPARAACLAAAARDKAERCYRKRTNVNEIQSVLAQVLNRVEVSF